MDQHPERWRSEDGVCYAHIKAMFQYRSQALRDAAAKQELERANALEKVIPITLKREQSKARESNEQSARPVY